MLRQPPRARGWELRPARAADMPAVRRMVISEAMNPLFLAEAHFVVAAESTSGSVLGAGQLRPVGRGAHELASLVVRPDSRRLGIGGAIVESILEARPPGEPVFLLTMGGERFYERFGFESAAADEVPPTMRAELAAGNVLGRFLGGEVVALKLREAENIGAAFAGDP